jgi:hypothetical protein
MIAIKKINLLIGITAIVASCVCGYAQVAVVDDFEGGSATGWSGTYNSSISYTATSFSSTSTTTLYECLYGLAGSSNGNMNILPSPVNLKRTDGLAPIGVAWDYVQVGNDIIVCAVNLNQAAQSLEWDTSNLGGETFSGYSPNTTFLPRPGWESRYFNGTAGGDSNWKVIDGGGDTRVLSIGNRGPDDSDCDWMLLYKGKQFSAQQGYTVLWRMYVGYPYGVYSGIVCDANADGTSYNKIDISSNFTVDQWYYYRLYRQGNNVTVWRNTTPFTSGNTGQVIINRTLSTDNGDYVGLYGVDFALFDDVGFYTGNFYPATGELYDLINGIPASKTFQLPSLGVFIGRLTP